MRLYTRTGAAALDDPATGIHYEADEQGGFNFPNELSDRLHSFHVDGKPMWENDVERQNRLVREEMARRQDPATLLQAVEQLVRAASMTAAAAPAPDPAPATTAAPKRRGRAAAAPAE